MIDLKEFKKVKDEKDHAVLQHPKGHEIKIAKAGLSKKLRSQLDALPHYADGTQVPVGYDAAMGDSGSVQNGDPMGTRPEQTMLPTVGSPAMPTMDALHNAIRNNEGQVPAGLNEGAPQGQAEGLTPTDTLPQAPQDQDPYGFQRELQQTRAGLGQETKGAQSMANAEQAQGTAQAGVQGQSAANIQQQADTYQNNLAKLNQEHDHFMNDVMNSHIDPNKYLGDMSTTGKISTAVGLLLGGMGGGLLHQENPAMKFLNAQIDRDIDTQKANLGTKRSLLEANLQQFHNLDAATQMTRIQMNDLTAAEMGQQASKFAGPKAQANAQMFIGKTKADNAARMQQLAMNAKLFSGAGLSNSKEIPDAIDPNLANSFRLNGTKHYAQDPQSAKTAREQGEALQGLTEAAKTINEFNKTNGTVGGPGVNLGFATKLKGQADTLNDMSRAAIAKLEASGGSIGRLANTFLNSMPVAGSTFQKEQEGKAQGIDNILRQANKSLLSTYSLQGQQPIGRKLAK